MSDKKYSAQEAAIMVLKKAEELYKLSSLSKAETKHDRCVKDVEANSPGVKNAHAVCVAEGVKPEKWSKSEAPLAKKYEGFEAVKESAAKSGASDPAAVAAAVGMKKYGKKRFEEHAHEGKKFKKSDEMGNNPDAAADAQLGEKVEQDVQQHEQGNQDPAHTMKGHIKLAKFMGRMDHKKEQSAKMQKGDGQTLGAAIGFPGAASTAPTPQPTATPSPTSMGKSEGKK